MVCPGAPCSGWRHHLCLQCVLRLAGERTITSLKTISKPVDQLDFPSVTICKGGQNLQAVREVLEGEVKEFFPSDQSDFEGEVEEWGKGRREKRSSSGSDYCQVVFHRTCDQVFIQELMNNDIFVFF